MSLLWTDDRLTREGYRPTGLVHSVDREQSPTATDRDAAALNLGVAPNSLTALFTARGWEWCLK